MDVFCIDSVDIDSIECIRDSCLVSIVSTLLRDERYTRHGVWITHGFILKTIQWHIHTGPWSLVN